MDIFNALNLIGGLSLFLFGMNVMGQALEKKAGNSLKNVLGKITGNRWLGLLTGIGITVVIQSSTATTVMVVGLVNSGLLTLSQSINVIMGANVGTTVTAWILSLAGIDSGNVFIRLLKPSSFTPVLALIGIVLFMFIKKEKQKDTGLVLLGFATLMFGMETMTGSISGLKDIPAFQKLFIVFKNPILGLLAGAVLTAIIQSSSASVGILQALALTGQVSYGAAIPLIMGQNIGTCVTALLSSIGANKNARRAACVHLCFNVIGSAFWLTIFAAARAFLNPALLDGSISLLGIAVVHSVFNVLCTMLMLPFSKALEKLVYILVPDRKEEMKNIELDERLLSTPSLALERCRVLMNDMADITLKAITDSFACLLDYSEEHRDSIQGCEDRTDHYEDLIGTYLLKLSSRNISSEESLQATEYLKLIGDFERIADHAVNMLESSQEISQKGIVLSGESAREIQTMMDAVLHSLRTATEAFKQNDISKAYLVEPVEQVVDDLRETIRTRFIMRMQKGEYSKETSFVLSDILTNLERISDHCSNIAGAVIDGRDMKLNLHESLGSYKASSKDFERLYLEYRNRYSV